MSLSGIISEIIRPTAAYWVTVDVKILSDVIVTTQRSARGERLSFRELVKGLTASGLSGVMNHLQATGAWCSLGNIQPAAIVTQHGATAIRTLAIDGLLTQVIMKMTPNCHHAMALACEMKWEVFGVREEKEMFRATCRLVILFLVCLDLLPQDVASRFDDEVRDYSGSVSNQIPTHFILYRPLLEIHSNIRFEFRSNNV